MVCPGRKPVSGGVEDSSLILGLDAGWAEALLKPLPGAQPDSAHSARLPVQRQADT